jgi:hypothetical protein
MHNQRREDQEFYRGVFVETKSSMEQVLALQRRNLGLAENGSNTIVTYCERRIRRIGHWLTIRNDGKQMLESFPNCCNTKHTPKSVGCQALPIVLIGASKQSST